MHKLGALEMLLPFSRHFSKGEKLRSLVVMEAIVLLPLLAGILGYASSFLPFAEWIQRACVGIAVVFIAVPYFQTLRRSA
jgi:hypothetical protein